MRAGKAHFSKSFWTTYTTFNDRIRDMVIKTHCVAQPVRGKVDNLTIKEISGDLFNFFICDRV